MNKNDLYEEISWHEYYNLKDRSGYYKIIDDIDIIYYKNGQYHRLDGPAYIDNNHYEYYINDKKYTKEEFYQHPEVIQYRIQKFQEYMK